MPKLAMLTNLVCLQVLTSKPASILGHQQHEMVMLQQQQQQQHRLLLLLLMAIMARHTKYCTRTETLLSAMAAGVGMHGVEDASLFVLRRMLDGMVTASSGRRPLVVGSGLLAWGLPKGSC